MHIKIITITFFTFIALGLHQIPKQISEATTQETPSLSFIKPQENISLAPGEIVEIELQGTHVAEVLLVGPEFVKTQKNNGTNIFTFRYQIPSQATENIKLVATGKTPEGSYTNSQELLLPLSLNTMGPLISLRVDSDFISLTVGDTRQINVYGTFSDGVERDITSTKFGTKYVLYPGKPANTEIISIDDEGKITAINPGQISLVVGHKDPVNAAGVVIKVSSN